MSISNSDTNAIVWILDDNKSGKITNVELTGTFVKRSLVRREVRYEAFQGNEFLWRDISWDNSNEKIIGSNLINVNNTVYFDSLTLLFNKEKTGENYFTGSYKILFNMQLIN
ncbi:hypothetical protein BCR32DRAFT_249240 [Anaeromyces robustus]|uniref:Uncharacterized protein n=1 Tax=Anaeromyces robustus TaxID=1754192 RepID=A0A1Y1WR05_9FUNG|nr:hypothetical protein BCR32DRAFT_249240 [Anaeromyces robustus]|eukprot:ORX75825.1 hypothetical protein BCR32DRAFT_249240 [Anaeromyces robustus]